MMRCLGIIMALVCTVYGLCCGEKVCSAEHRVARVKQAQSYTLVYSYFDSVCIELPQEKQKRIAELLEHLHPNENYTPGCRVTFHFDSPSVTIVCTTADGSSYELTTWWIGVDGAECSYAELCLPREIKRELNALVSYKANKEAVHRAIVQQGREFMARKAEELELIKSATDVRAELRCNIRGMERVDPIPLSPAAKAETLRILSAMQLVPADKVVERKPSENEYRYLILTCGDKTYELKMDDICTPSMLEPQEGRSWHAWQNRPFLLPDSARARLIALTPIPKKKGGK